MNASPLTCAATRAVPLRPITSALVAIGPHELVPVEDVLLICRIDNCDGDVWGVVGLARMDGRERPLLRPTEAVDAAYVRACADMLSSSEWMTSTTLLLTSGTSGTVAALARAAVAGRPPTSDVTAPVGSKPVDEVRHRLWTLGPCAAREDLLDLLAGQHLVVADGNHRWHAARLAGLSTLLGMVTDDPRVVTGPMDRLLVGGAHRAPALAERWRAAGLVVQPVDHGHAPRSGTAVLGAAGQAWAVRLPHLPRLQGMPPPGDHTVVDGVLLADLDPPAAALDRRHHRTAQPSDAVVRIAPLTREDVLRAASTGRLLGRKSTAVHPKPLNGHVLARLERDPCLPHRL